jgi:biotin carboxyl carrier protein
MKLQLEIDGQTIEAEFTLAEDAAQLSFDGQTHQARVSQPEPGMYAILLGNRVYNCLVDTLPTSATEIVVGSRRVAVAVRDRKQLRGNTGGAGGPGGRAVLTAPMPGKIVRVLCAAGDEVAANQGLLVVEAMKMQNEVQSPKAGKVAELKVVEGQTVNAGEMLVVIE